jgi:hypothetical protein
MITRDKYNGWRNYETWAVNAHLTNETHSYEWLMAIVQNCDTLHDQAQAVREWVRFDEGTESYDLEADVLTGMCADLLAAAFDMVDWPEIIRTNQEGQR